MDEVDYAATLQDDFEIDDEQQQLLAGVLRHAPPEIESVLR